MTVESLHDNYGDTVRIALNMLSFNNSQVWARYDFICKIMFDFELNIETDVNGHRKGRKDLERDPNIFRHAPGEASDIIRKANTQFQGQRLTLDISSFQRCRPHQNAASHQPRILRLRTPRTRIPHTPLLRFSHKAAP